MNDLKELEKIFRKIPNAKTEIKSLPQIGYIRSGTRGMEDVLFIKIGRYKIMFDNHCWRILET